MTWRSIFEARACHQCMESSIQFTHAQLCMPPKLAPDTWSSGSASKLCINLKPTSNSGRKAFAFQVKSVKMQASIHHTNTSSRTLSSSRPLHRITPPPHQKLTIPLSGLSIQLRKNPSHRWAAQCAKWDSGSNLLAELEREIEAEMNPKGDNWMIELGKFKKKCKERKGILELLECLEREAIMGEDEGRNPVDYNRRAQIFDRSSRVFQALKEHAIPSHQS